MGSVTTFRHPATRPMRSLLLAIAVAASASAQVCPALEGAAAITCVADGYTPSRVLSSAASKDRLYDTVDRVEENGVAGVAGLYTGLFVPFDGSPNSDPSQDVFNDGAGINQEHVWPRSRGTDNNAAEVDLHHLFPTRVQVNSDRGSDPFGTIPDTSPSTWYRDTAQQRAAPSDPETWSQDSGSAFEPRASVRGDVARAMFYVAAVYADRVDLAWFERQRETLLAWHRDDPVLEADLGRSARVAQFQTGCAAGPCLNPFVEDETLAARAFGSQPTVLEGDPGLEVVGAPWPNPTTGRVVLSAPAARIEVVDALGRIVQAFDLEGGDLEVDLSSAPVGVYAVRVTTEAGVAVRRVVVAR